jgi:predicted nuclease of predicted toxin-antitoxin system
MRILLDHNVPVPLRFLLDQHDVATAFECGWAELTNGELLAAAEKNGFDLLITSDKGIRYQQNMADRRLALILLSTNDWMRIRRCRSLVTDAILRASSRTFTEVDIPLLGQA